jgi:hypothetical protein
LWEPRAPRGFLRGAMSLPKYLQYSVALCFSSVSSVVKKVQWRSVVKKPSVW